jgi:hypothetical protein
MRLPWESSKDGSREATRCERVLSVEGVNKLLGVSKVSSWFPAVMPSIIALPFDKVLILVAILTTVQDTFNFVFEFVFNLNRFRGWWVLSVDVIAVPWREAVDVEDRVLTHR